MVDLLKIKVYPYGYFYSKVWGFVVAVWVGGISKYSVHFVSKNERNIFLVSDLNYFQSSTC